MDIVEKKRLITSKIDEIQNERLIRAIEKLLDIEDYGETPDWHLPLVKERLEQYLKNPNDVVKWEDIKKRWKDEL
jgi:hypothetical protein